MRILKSLLAGVGMTSVAVVLLLVIGLVLVSLYAKRFPPKQQGGIGWDPISALTLPGFILYLVLAFATGFWLAYRN